MAGSSGYLYVVRMPATAVTAAKTLIQLKTGAAAADIAAIRIMQTSKTTSELLVVQLLRKSAAATVTSATPLLINPNDPAALAVGGTSSTGYNASAEGTDTDIIEDDVWNVVNGSLTWEWVPERRPRVPQTAFIGLKLNTAPASSMSITAEMWFIEYR